MIIGGNEMKKQRWTSVWGSQRDQSYLIFDVAEQGLEFFFKLASDARTCHYRG